MNYNFYFTIPLISEHASNKQNFPKTFPKVALKFATNKKNGI